MFKLRPISALTVSTGIACALLAGCSSQPTVSYTSTDAVDTTTIDFGSTDLQSISDKMVSDMLKSPALARLSESKPAVAPAVGAVKAAPAMARPPVLFISDITNRTQEHIDTTSITDSIQTKLLNSGKFSFVDMKKVDAVKQQLNYQQNSGLVNQNTAVQVGKQIGAHYMLYGSLSSINKRNDSTQSLYYQFTLRLMNVKSGLIIWQAQKDIRKVAKRSTFGW